MANYLGQPFPQPASVNADLLNYLGQVPQQPQQRPFSERLGSALMTTWPAQMAKSAFLGATLPGDVYAGRVDPMSDEALGRSVDLAGLATLGSGAMPAAKGAGTELRAGIKAYHGSPHDFDRFDIGKAGSTTDAGQLGRGVYFSTDPRVAEGAAKRYEVNVGMKNPIELSMPDFRTDKQRLIQEKLNLPAGSSAADISAEALRRGHDGVVLDYGPTGYSAKEIAVYDDKLISIMRKYGVGSLAALPASVLAGMGMTPDQAQATDSQR